MKTTATRLILLLLPVLPLPASAILLDCEITAEHVYRCIEIGGSTADTGADGEPEGYNAEYTRYIEAARKECIYNEPRQRSGKTTGLAVKSEQLKSAREDYEACVTEKARALWLKNRSAEPADSSP